MVKIASGSHYLYNNPKCQGVGNTGIIETIENPHQVS
jgi:hypothetical protein